MLFGEDGKKPPVRRVAQKRRGGIPLRRAQQYFRAEAERLDLATPAVRREIRAAGGKQ